MGSDTKIKNNPINIYKSIHLNHVAYHSTLPKVRQSVQITGTEHFKIALSHYNGYFEQSKPFVLNFYEEIIF